MPAPLWEAVESLLRGAQQAGTVRDFNPEWRRSVDVPERLHVTYADAEATDCHQVDDELHAFGFKLINQDGRHTEYQFTSQRTEGPPNEGGGGGSSDTVVTDTGRDGDSPNGDDDGGGRRRDAYSYEKLTVNWQ